MTTADILMTPQPVTCRTTDSANHAARLMWEHDVGALPVVDEDGKLCGIVTDRDLCMGAYTQGKTLGAIDVGSTMAGDVVAVTAADDAGQIEALMRQHRVRRIPVIDRDDRPIGIVSLNDLARRSDVTAGAAVHEHDLTETMRAICTPRNLPSPAPSQAVAAVPEQDRRREIVKIDVKTASA